MSEEVKEIEEATKEAPEEQIETVEQIKEELATEKKEEVKDEVKEEKKPKTITCPKCNKNMLLRSYKYKHELNCKGKAEQRTEVKRQAKPKGKATKIVAKPIANQVVEEEHEVSCSIREPIYFQEVKAKTTQQQIHTPQQPPQNPMTSILDNYKLFHQEYLNKKREKTNALCSNMFSGSLRSKRR